MERHRPRRAPGVRPGMRRPSRPAGPLRPSSKPEPETDDDLDEIDDFIDESDPGEAGARLTSLSALSSGSNRRPAGPAQHGAGSASSSRSAIGDEPTKFEFDTQIRIVRKLAEGGMGTVYLAEQIGEVGFVKTVALKVIRSDRLTDERGLRMFLDEAKLTADLVHMNIAQVYYLGSVGAQYFIVMEFLHAKTLREFMKEHRDRKQLPPMDYSAFIVSRICRALYYAHTKTDRAGRPLGIVHRDVTPSNIMIDFRGFVKLTDFGIAKALTMNMPDETKVVMGKYPYMSPEQAAGVPTDGRSDIFSLGLVLYELVTGARVYSPKDRKELLYMMQNYRIKDPRSINPHLPEELGAIIMKSLEKSLDARYQDARDFGDALEKYMYSKGYGPTNEKLARYMAKLFPSVDRDRIE